MDKNTIVELKNGAVGIVLKSDPKYRQLPQLSLVLDNEKQPQQAQIVDLLALDKAGETNGLLIHKVLKNGAYGVDLKDFSVTTLFASAKDSDSNLEPDSESV